MLKSFPLVSYAITQAITCNYKYNIHTHTYIYKLHKILNVDTPLFTADVAHTELADIASG